jgi:hypothetical protein
MPSFTSVRRTGKWECSTSWMISSFSQAGYLMRRHPIRQILDERAYVQVRAIIESLREDLAKVVVRDAYRKAAEALDKHSFVLLVGEPAAGKTTIASLLAMAALDQWHASMLKLDEPGKVAERWNPDEPSQFFWLDDAFGVTQYDDFLVHRWNHILPQIKTMLRKGAKIVMTSRDYIYNRVRKDLKESAFPLLNKVTEVRRPILPNRNGCYSIKITSRIPFWYSFMASLATLSIPGAINPPESTFTIPLAN